MIKKILKQKRTWAIVVVLLVVGAGIAFGHGAKPPVFVTATVENGTLTQTVEATGTLTSAHEARFAFQASGIVVAVPKIGDAVKPGQVLGRLAGTELFASAEGARRSVQIAQASLAAARTSVANMDTDLANARRAAVAGSNKDTNALDVAHQDVATTLPSSLIVVRKAMSDADEILGIDNTLVNDVFEKDLGILDAGSLNNANNAYAVAKRSRSAIEGPVFALSATAPYVEVQALVPGVQASLADTATMLLSVSRTLDGTSAGTTDFSVAELSAFKASMNAARSAVQTAQASLRAKLQAVASAPLAGASNSQNAQSAVDAALASLANAKAVVAMREVEVLQAEASFDAAQARAANTLIRSSLAGIVTVVDVDPGEAVSAGSPVITVQTVGDQFEIKLNIPESDIAKVAVGQSVDTTFDAFGDCVHFSGTVSFVNPAQKTIEGVVYYETTITLIPVAGHALKPGLTADATITTMRVEHALTIPQRAVLQKDGESTVRVKTSATTFDERLVKTGARGDGGRVEIINGLKEGEEIVVSVK